MRWRVFHILRWTCSKQCQLSELPEAICCITPRCIVGSVLARCCRVLPTAAAPGAPEVLVAFDLLSAVAIVVNATGV